LKYSYVTLIKIGFFLGLILQWSIANAALPPKVEANLILKVLNFNKSITPGSNITVHVIGNDAIGQALQKLSGRRVGKAKLGDVTFSGSLPASAVNVIYTGDGGQVEGVKGFAASSNALTIAGDSAWVEKGLILGFVVEGGKPKFVINLTQSKAQGIDWNPAILKIANIVN